MNSPEQESPLAERKRPSGPQELGCGALSGFEFHGVSVWGDEKCRTRQGWQPHNAVNILNITDLNTLKRFKMVTFLCIYHKLKKKKKGQSVREERKLMKHGWWKGASRSRAGRISLKCPSTQSGLHIQCSPYPSPEVILCRNRKNSPNIYMEPQKTLNSQSISGKKNRAGGITLCHYAAVIKTVGPGTKTDT